MNFFILGQAFGGDDRDPVIILTDQNLALRLLALVQRGRVTRNNGLAWRRPFISSRPGVVV